MTDDLMPTDLPPHDPTLGIATRTMSMRDAQKTIVQVELTGTDPGVPAFKVWRQEFPSRPAAEEFARSLYPDPRQTGSPIQARLKRAKLLRIDPEWVDRVNLKVSFEESKPDDPTRTASRGARSVRGSDRSAEPIGSTAGTASSPAAPSESSTPRPNRLEPPGASPDGLGPAPADGGGFDLFSQILASPEDELPGD